MASIGTDANGHRRILFYSPDGTRKTVRLGKCPKKAAETFKIRVEHLLSARIAGHAPDPELSRWLAELDAKVHDKLVRVGLADPRESPDQSQQAARVTLDQFLTDYMARRGPSKKPATRIVWGQVMRMLRDYMPTGIALEDVTVGHAKNFVEQCNSAGLASSTTYKRVGFARQFFEDAVDWELIDKNPFAKVKLTRSSAKSNVEVPRETIEQVLRHCDTTWSAIVALSRYGGLRCPSEVLSLRWSDIDWEGSRMSVTEPKVEHHEGRGVRLVPLFPELRKHLDTAFAIAPDGAEFVIDKPAYRKAAMTAAGWANANLRTQFMKLLKKAGVTPWPRLFHSMRASRQTELERQFPRHVVCAWMGNTSAVAERHYLLVSEDDFKAASKPEKAAPKAARSSPKAARKAAP